MAAKAGVSAAAVHLVENGRGSLELLLSVAAALSLTVELDVMDRARRRSLVQAQRAEDPVHSFMAELEASHFRRLGFEVGIDEPYQHFQFAGRADVISWSLRERALLHLENRTRFPNYQEAIGSYNSKRSYLAEEIAKRVGVSSFRTVTHAMVCLWSGEMLHALRMRAETFRSISPDTPHAFRSWWEGVPAEPRVTSTVIVIDPFADGDQREWIDLSTALHGGRPRLADYADAVRRLKEATRS